MGRRYRRWTDKIAEEYLTHLRRHGLLKQAARAVGVSYSNVQRIRREDPLFAQQIQEALDEAAEGLEAEAWRRAVEGWDTPVVQKALLVRDENGEPVTITRYSDSLLAMLLRKSNPQFRDKAELAVNVRGYVTNQVNVYGDPTRQALLEALDISDLRYLTRDERRQMGSLLNQIVERKEKQGTGRHQGYVLVPALEDGTNE